MRNGAQLQQSHRALQRRERELEAAHEAQQVRPLSSLLRIFTSHVLTVCLTCVIVARWRNVDAVGA